MSGSAKAGTTAERHTLRAAGPEYVGFCALLRCARQENCFFLTMTYIDVGYSEVIPIMQHYRSGRRFPCVSVDVPRGRSLCLIAATTHHTCDRDRCRDANRIGGPPPQSQHRSTIL